MPFGAKDAEFRRVAIRTRPIQRKGLRVTELLLLMSDKPCRLCDMGKPHKVGLFPRAFIYKGSRGSILINLIIYEEFKMKTLCIYSKTKQGTCGELITAIQGSKDHCLQVASEKYGHCLWAWDRA